MATSVEAGRTPSHDARSREGDLPALRAIVQWINGHRQITGAIVAILLVGGGLTWWSVVSRNRVEAAADQKLGAARLAFESRNYPLAASELSQIVENYSGSRAADQANLLLAQVRLYQGQPQQAIDLLKRVAPSMRRDTRAQAYGLLGAAQENAGHWSDAAGSYEAAAQRAPYAFLKAQYLSDAARSWLVVKDTAKALADYRTIISGMDSTSNRVEAEVRVGELTKGSGVR
ncbi:MAG TPA: tetratricopeptide repeat protein [Gemmatimonadales bacterium]|nr:tetratricopeptide repeat protein [Gemmatimonadales bacterium]